MSLTHRFMARGIVPVLVAWCSWAGTAVTVGAQAAEQAAARAPAQAVAFPADEPSELTQEDLAVDDEEPLFDDGGEEELFGRDDDEGAAETAEASAEMEESALANPQGEMGLGELVEDTDFVEAHEEMHEPTHVTLGAIFSSYQFLAGCITFLTLVLLIWYFAFRKGRPVPVALAARRREIEEQLAEAQRLKAEAEAKKAEYSKRLTEIESELATLREEMVRAGELERDRMVAEAEAKAEAILKDSEFTKQQRLKQLREELTQEVVAAAVAAAETVLRAETQPADQARLAESYVESLGRIGGSGAHAVAPSSSTPSSSASSRPGSISGDSLA